MLGCEDEQPQVRWVSALQAVDYAGLLHTSESWGCSPCLHADAPVSPHSEHVHCIGWQEADWGCAGSSPITVICFCCRAFSKPSLRAG